MDFRTRPISQVLDDLVAKLEAMPPRHPDRPTLIRMVIDLRREIDRRPQKPAGAAEQLKAFRPHLSSGGSRSARS